MGYLEKENISIKMKNYWKKISKNTLDLANGCLMQKINEKPGLVRVLIIN